MATMKYLTHQWTQPSIAGRVLWGRPPGTKPVPTTRIRGRVMNDHNKLQQWKSFSLVFKMNTQVFVGLFIKVHRRAYHRTAAVNLYLIWFGLVYKRKGKCSRWITISCYACEKKHSELIATWRMVTVTVPNPSVLSNLKIEKEPLVSNFTQFCQMSLNVPALLSSLVVVQQSKRTGPDLRFLCCWTKNIRSGCVLFDWWTATDEEGRSGTFRPISILVTK